MRFLPVKKIASFVLSKHAIALPVILVLFILSDCSAPFDKQGEEVYKKNCAGCHGPQLQGSAASALIKETLKYGNDHNAILKTVRNGIPGTEMIKWDSILSDKDIEAVTNYILAVRDDPRTVKTDVKPLKIQTRLIN